MCVVNLNVTLQPCAHRWYTLRRPCTPSTNLSNCPEKVRLEGWEIRTEACPWCCPSASSSSSSYSGSSEIDMATHRLFGSSDLGQSRRRSDSTVASADSWLARGRASSLSLFSPITSRSSSRDSELSVRRESDRAEKNQTMNRRLEDYIAGAVPEYVAPSRRASLMLSVPVLPKKDTSRRASLMLPMPALPKKDTGDAASFLGVSSGMLSGWGSLPWKKKKKKKKKAHG